jgi:hypothetical protein
VAVLKKVKTIIWRWDDVGVELPITVKKVTKNLFISFLWSASGVQNSVKILLKSLDETTTLIMVREDGWESDEEGIKTVWSTNTRLGRHGYMFASLH